LVIQLDFQVTLCFFVADFCGPDGANSGYADLMNSLMLAIPGGDTDRAMLLAHCVTEFRSGYDTLLDQIAGYQQATSAAYRKLPQLPAEQAAPVNVQPRVGAPKSRPQPPRARPAPTPAKPQPMPPARRDPTGTAAESKPAGTVAASRWKGDVQQACEKITRWFDRVDRLVAALLVNPPKIPGKETRHPARPGDPPGEGRRHRIAPFSSCGVRCRRLRRPGAGCQPLHPAGPEGAAG
jgi:hypothetical protein